MYQGVWWIIGKNYYRNLKKRQTGETMKTNRRNYEVQSPRYIHSLSKEGQLSAFFIHLSRSISSYAFNCNLLLLVIHTSITQTHIWKNTENRLFFIDERGVVFKLDQRYFDIQNIEQTLQYLAHFGFKSYSGSIPLILFSSNSEMEHIPDVKHPWSW